MTKDTIINEIASNSIDIISSSHEMVIDKNGNEDKSWYLNGNLHREDGPAIERGNGDKLWLIDSRLHREDGPAVEKENGERL